MKSSRPRGASIAIVMTTLVTVVCLAVLGFMFVWASSDARDAIGDQSFPQSIFGLPVLEGFHLDGKFGVHMKPGALIFIAIPILAGILLKNSAMNRFARRDH